MLKYITTPPDKATCAKFNYLISWFFLSVYPFLIFFGWCAGSAVQALFLMVHSFCLCFPPFMCLLSDLQCKALISLGSFFVSLFTSFSLFDVRDLQCNPPYLMVLSLCLCLPPSYLSCAQSAVQIPRISWFLLSISLHLLFFG